MLVVLIVIAIFLLWWFSFRPSMRISHCSIWAVSEARSKQGDREDYEYFYIKCLRENGIEGIGKKNWD